MSPPATADALFPREAMEPSPTRKLLSILSDRAVHCTACPRRKGAVPLVGTGHGAEFVVLLESPPPGTVSLGFWGTPVGGGLIRMLGVAGIDLHRVMVVFALACESPLAPAGAHFKACEPLWKSAVLGAPRKGLLVLGGAAVNVLSGMALTHARSRTQVWNGIPWTASYSPAVLATPGVDADAYWSVIHEDMQRVQRWVATLDIPPQPVTPSVCPAGQHSDAPPAGR